MIVPDSLSLWMMPPSFPHSIIDSSDSYCQPQCQKLQSLSSVALDRPHLCLRQRLFPPLSCASAPIVHASVPVLPPHSAPTSAHRLHRSMQLSYATSVRHDANVHAFIKTTVMSSILTAQPILVLIILHVRFRLIVALDIQTSLFITDHKKSERRP